MKRTCKQCGAEFTLSEQEIAFYRSKNLHLPKRCEKCRRENRAKANGNTVKQVVRPYHEKREGSVRWYVAAALVFVLLTLGIGAFRAVWLQEGTQPDAEITEDSASADLQTEIPEDTQAEISDGTGRVPMDMSQDNQEAVSGKTDDVVADTPQQTPEDTQTAKTAPSEYAYSFRKAEYLQEHFEKHGAEFGYASAEEYLAGANRVVASPDVLHKLEAEDGDDVYYLESSNEFVIVSTDGHIRTYFKPDDGKAYFDRQ